MERRLEKIKSWKRCSLGSSKRSARRRSLESGLMLWRLNHELLPDPGRPIANTTVPRDTGDAGTCGTPPPEATPTPCSGSPPSSEMPGSMTSGAVGVTPLLPSVATAWPGTARPPRPRPPRRRRRRRASPVRCGCVGIDFSSTSGTGSGSGSLSSGGLSSGFVS